MLCTCVKLCALHVGVFFFKLERARLGPELEAIVLAAPGQRNGKRNTAQALRPKFSHSLANTKQFAGYLDDGETGAIHAIRVTR